MEKNESTLYYKCDICGNVLQIIEDGGATPQCCGQSMTPMTQKEYMKICGNRNGK